MEFDNELFAEGLRRRLKRLLEIRGQSMTMVSKASGVGPNSLKEFISGRKRSPKLETFLAWSRGLDVEVSVLIDGLGYDLEGYIDPRQARSDWDEEKSAEQVARLTAARNMRFLRAVLGQTKLQFAQAINKENPDQDMIEACESGQQIITQIGALKLAEAYGLTLDDFYR